MVVDFSNSLGFVIGAVIGALWLRYNHRQAATYNVPAASGLVAGESLVAAVLTIVCALAGLLARG